MKYCSDLPLKFSCCNSCHDDHNEFGMDLLDAEYNNEEYYVCCGAIVAIEEDRK